MKNVALFTGSDTFLVNKNINKYIQDNNLKQYEPIIYSLDETSIQEVLNDAETYPFFDDKKLIIVRNPVFLSASKIKCDIDHNIERFKKYINNPSESTILLIHAPYEKIVKDDLMKLIKEKSEVINTTVYNDRSIEEWIKTQLAKYKISIATDALYELGKRTNYEFSLIVSEVSKLINYSDENTYITLDVIKKLVPRSVEDNVFELVNNYINGNTSKALNIYYDLQTQNTEPLFLLNLIANQFRFLYKARYLFEVKKMNQSKIAEELKVKIGRIKANIQNIKKLSLNEIEKNINEINDLDYKIKTGRIDKKLGLELFLLKN